MLLSPHCGSKRSGNSPEGLTFRQRVDYGQTGSNLYGGRETACLHRGCDYQRRWGGSRRPHAMTDFAQVEGMRVWYPGVSDLFG
jgi:hypothetical protein